MAQKQKKKKSQVDKCLKQVNRKARRFVNGHKKKCEKKIKKINGFLEKRLESRLTRVEFGESGPANRGSKGAAEEGVLPQAKCDSVDEEVPVEGETRLHLQAKGKGQVPGVETVGSEIFLLKLFYLKKYLALGIE